jgi:hypothetical protein
MTRTGEQDPQERFKLIRSTFGEIDPVQDVVGDQWYRGERAVSDPCGALSTL